MNPATRLFHQTLIRAAKMALAAWEKWLTECDRIPAPPIHPGSPRGPKE